MTLELDMPTPAQAEADVRSWLSFHGNDGFLTDAHIRLLSEHLLTLRRLDDESVWFHVAITARALAMHRFDIAAVRNDEWLEHRAQGRGQRLE